MKKNWNIGKQFIYYQSKKESKRTKTLKKNLEISTNWNRKEKNINKENFNIVTK